jgi:hypothetical protein
MHVLLHRQRNCKVHANLSSFLLRQRPFVQALLLPCLCACNQLLTASLRYLMLLQMPTRTLMT